MNRNGFALVSALGLMVVLMTVVGLLSVAAVSELQQSRANVQLTQARAVAEAGEVYARYALANPARDQIRDLLRPSMSTVGDPTKSWILPEDRWQALQTEIEDMLNANYGALGAANVNGLGSASIRYQLANFRGNLRSLTAQSYLVDYTIVSTGTTNGAARRVQDKGVFEIQLGKPSLSQYLFLVDDAEGNNGFFPTGSRFNGPVHANKNWGFWGSPEFLDTITTADDGAYFYNAGGSCRGANRTWIKGDSRPPCTVPHFAKGFTRNAAAVELPSTSLSQRRAALGLDPDSLANPSQKTLCQQLRLSKNCNNHSAVPNGVYLVNDGGSVSGGIYVQGDLDSLTLDGSGRDGRQHYTFRQGARTWTIVVDYAANTTAVTDPEGKRSEYLGVPSGGAPLGTGGATGQIYVEGEIRNLAGPGRSGSLGAAPADHPLPEQLLPALAKETQLNIAAVGKISLTTDLVYECDPTALSSSAYLGKHPRCDTGGEMLPTVLGVMSQSSDIEITTQTPDDLYLWGSYLAGANGKGLTVQNYNSRGPQGKLRLFGGVIQSKDKLRGTINGWGELSSGYLETYDYDLRFANGGVAPPNFPTVRTFDVQNIVPVKLSFYEF